MTATVFVDTNVFVYARDVSETVKRLRAIAWVEHLWRGHSGRTGMQVLAEYYANVTRKLKPPLSREDAWEDVRSMLLWRPQAVDEAVLVRANEIERRHRLSWWEAQIVAAAQIQRCAVLLTEDLQDGGTFGEVTVRNPFKLAIEEARAQYGLADTAPERHPKRGRPARVRV